MDRIEIKLKRYLELLKAERFLEVLEREGVDNWEGFDDAVMRLGEGEEDEND